MTDVRTEDTFYAWLRQARQTARARSDYVGLSPRRHTSLVEEAFLALMIAHTAGRPGARATTKWMRARLVAEKPSRQPAQPLHKKPLLHQLRHYLQRIKALQKSNAIFRRAVQAYRARGRGGHPATEALQAAVRARAAEKRALETALLEAQQALVGQKEDDALDAEEHALATEEAEIQALEAELTTTEEGAQLLDAPPVRRTSRARPRAPVRRTGRPQPRAPVLQGVRRTWPQRAEVQAAERPLTAREELRRAILARREAIATDVGREETDPSAVWEEDKADGTLVPGVFHTQYGFEHAILNQGPDMAVNHRPVNVALQQIRARNPLMLEDSPDITTVSAGSGWRTVFTAILHDFSFLLSVSNWGNLEHYIGSAENQQEARTQLLRDREKTIRVITMLITDAHAKNYSKALNDLLQPVRRGWWGDYIFRPTQWPRMEPDEEREAAKTLIRKDREEALSFLFLTNVMVMIEAREYDKAALFIREDIHAEAVTQQAQQLLDDWIAERPPTFGPLGANHLDESLRQSLAAYSECCIHRMYFQGNTTYVPIRTKPPPGALEGANAIMASSALLGVESVPPPSFPPGGSLSTLPEEAMWRVSLGKDDLHPSHLYEVYQRLQAYHADDAYIAACYNLITNNATYTGRLELLVGPCYDAEAGALDELRDELAQEEWTPVHRDTAVTIVDKVVSLLSPFAVLVIARLYAERINSWEDSREKRDRNSWGDEAHFAIRQGLSTLYPQFNAIVRMIYGVGETTLWAGHVRHIYASLTVDAAHIHTFADAYTHRARSLYLDRHWQPTPPMLTLVGGRDDSEADSVHFEILLTAFPAIRRFVNFPGAEETGIRDHLRLTLEDFGRQELRLFVAYAYLGEAGLVSDPLHVEVWDYLNGLLNLLGVVGHWIDIHWTTTPPLLDHTKLAIMHFLRRVRGHSTLPTLRRLIRRTRDAIRGVRWTDQADAFRAMFHVVAKANDMTPRDVRYGFDVLVNEDTPGDASAIHYGFDFLLGGDTPQTAWPVQPDLEAFREWIHLHRRALQRVAGLGQRASDVAAFRVLARENGITLAEIQAGFTSLVRALNWPVSETTGWPVRDVAAEAEELREVMRQAQDEEDLFLQPEDRAALQTSAHAHHGYGGITAAWVPMAVAYKASRAEKKRRRRTRN